MKLILVTMNKGLLLSFILIIFATNTMLAQKFYVENAQGQLIGYKVIDKESRFVSVIKGKSKYSDRSYIIPEKVNYRSEEYTVTELGEKAFHECENVRSLILPNTVKIIRDDAVQNCKFSEFIFPADLYYIEENAFAWTDLSDLSGTISRWLRSEFKLPMYEGIFKLYKWEKVYGLIFKHTISGKEISLNKLETLKRSLNNVYGKKYSSPMLKGSYSLTSFELDGFMTFTNSETNRKLYARSSPELETLLEQEMRSCFKPSLTSIERTANGNTAYTIFEEISKDSLVDFEFHDEFISASIKIAFSSNAISYSIKNESNGSIKIIWDDAALVNHEGKSSALVNGETRFIDVEKSQKSAIIVKNSKKEGYIFPEDYIHGTTIEPFMPKYSPEIIDKKIIILLSLLIGDVKYEYSLTFTIMFDDEIGIRK